MWMLAKRQRGSQGDPHIEHVAGHHTHHTQGSNGRQEIDLPGRQLGRRNLRRRRKIGLRQQDAICKRHLSARLLLPQQLHRRMQRIERKAPQGLVQRALTALIMYPAHALSLSTTDIETLEQAAGESRDLITETIAAAKSAGRSVDFIAMSDALRESPNVEVYEALMEDILRVDEYKRDLLLDDAGNPDQAARREEQQTLRARELRDAILKLREQAIVAELARISSSGLAGADSAEDYRRLIEERNRIRQKSDE